MASSSSAPVLGVAVRGQCALRGCTKSVHVDPGTGITHDYCGRSHAQEAQGAIQAPHGVCHTCQLPGCHESVHYEADIGRVHEYCCRSHAQEAQARGLAPPSNRQRQGQGTPHNRCSLPGCSAPRYIDPSTGSEHDFCGRTHAREATVRAALPATLQALALDLALAPSTGPAPAPKLHFHLILARRAACCPPPPPAWPQRVSTVCGAAERVSQPTYSPSSPTHTPSTKASSSSSATRGATPHRCRP